MSYSEDILNDALFLLGESSVPDVAAIQYGPLTMTVAPKVIDQRYITESSHQLHPTGRQSAITAS